MNIEGIILAAGFSSRAGAYKLTLELDGKTVIERCIEGMYDACSRIIVIGGYKVEKLVPILDKYPKIELIYNQDYVAGMFSSVKEGFKHAKGDRIFLTPGDYPLISYDVYKSLLGVPNDIVIPVYKGVQGHPVLLNRRMANLLLSASEYSNLGEFIAANRYKTVEVQSPGILMDIDTREDYLKVQGRFIDGNASHRNELIG